MLEDFKINVKIKLAVLWTSVMFCYIYEDYFELYVPKRVERINKRRKSIKYTTEVIWCLMGIDYTRLDDLFYQYC